MPLEKSGLIGLLTAVDDELERKITLVAAGGMAMTLLDLKLSTIDIDFTGPYEDVKVFNRIQKDIPHGFKVDTWTDGAVFSQMLPDDYLKKSIPVKTKLRRVQLRALYPLDIVVTKIGRLNERDLAKRKSRSAKVRFPKGIWKWAQGGLNFKKIGFYSTVMVIMPTQWYNLPINTTFKEKRLLETSKSGDS